VTAPTGPLEPRRRDPFTLVVGLLLIGAGALFLVAQRLDFSVRLDWPWFVIIPGLALVALGVLGGATSLRFLVIPGCIATAAGLVLLYQRETDSYASWAYLWALIAPGSVGIGTILLGLLDGDPRTVRAGVGTAVVGLTIAVVGALFFEGVLDLTHGRAIPVGRLGLPVLVIGLGVVILLGSLVGRSRRVADDR
jgi:hypothetical protein